MWNSWLTEMEQEGGEGARVHSLYPIADGRQPTTTQPSAHTHQQPISTEQPNSSAGALLMRHRHRGVAVSHRL